MNRKLNSRITLQYLEYYCTAKDILIGCRQGDDELWISCLGSHPSDLSASQVDQILDESRLFEVREYRYGEEDHGEDPPRLLLTRKELEERLGRMVN